MPTISKHLAILLGAVLLTHIASAAPPPNVVLIFVDDMGVNDVGAYTSPSKANAYPSSGPSPVAYPQFAPLPAPNVSKNLTPHIDSLATNGLKMTSFYAASPVCTPSRAALLTGSYATRVGMEGVILPANNVYGLHSQEVTLAERLKQRGYRTALVGKWHLGDSADFNPLRHGFDEFFGLTSSHDVWPENPYAPDLQASPLKLYDGESAIPSGYTTGTGGLLTTPINTYTEQAFLLEAFTERSLKFMERSHTADAPFFLYFASHAPHVPCVPHPTFDGASGVSKYYDVMMELDHRVGQILAKLDALGVANNTLVLFTSDNGPWHTRPGVADPMQTVGSAYPFRGYKRLTQEGGPRVPLLARFPGKIPSGSVTDELASNLDLLPTILRLAAMPVPADRVIDGIDLWPLWSGASTTSPRPRFYYYSDSATNAEALRQGPWKLSGGALFHLPSDPQESNNVAAANAQLTTSLQTTLSDWNNAMSSSRRARGLPQSNQIEIATDRVYIPFGGTATVRVRLAQSATATVSLAHFSGNTGLSVTGPTMLAFTPANHRQWQSFTLRATPAANTQNGGATFRLSSGSMHVREIFAFVGSPLPNTLNAHWSFPQAASAAEIRDQLSQSPATPLPAGVTRSTGVSAAPASTGYLQFTAGNPVHTFDTQISGASLGGSGPKTFVAWINAQAANGTIVSYSPVGGSQAGKALRLLLDTDGRLRAELNSAFLKTREPSLVGQGWRMVAAIFDTDRDTSRLYIGGTGLLAGPALDFGGTAGNIRIDTASQADAGFSPNIVIGNADTHRPFSGGIDMVSVYQGALDEAQLDYLFAQGTRTGLHDFRVAQNLPADGSADTATPAGDGVANLLKYAFNLIDADTVTSVAMPTSLQLTPDTIAGLPSASLGAASPHPLSITYIRRRASSYPGINYLVQFSSDLGAADAWAASPAATESAVAINSALERVTVTDSAPSPAVRFARVRVSVR